MPALYADEAVLIPALLATLPFEVFATSSIDALIHAVESTVSPKANAFTRALGGSAITLILNGYRALAEKPPKTLPDEAGMKDFLVASTMAGIAFGNAGCAAVHALSYPIGGIYHVPHGKANYMVFEQVFAAYRQKGADLAPLEGVLAQTLGCRENEVWTSLFALLGTIYQNQPLGALGATAQNCAEMAESVIANQQRLLANNPVPLSTSEVCAIYERCL